MIRPIEPDLWVLETPFVMGPVAMGLRMTIIRLRDGTLWVHSPVHTTPADRAELDRLGAVAHIVAPNLMHHLFAAELAAHYPQARLYAAPGLANKVPALARAESLPTQPIAAWDHAIRPFSLAGIPRLQETIFLFRRTLIVTDLVFNIPTLPWGVGRVMMQLNGAVGGVRASRLMRHVVVADRPAFRASLAKLLAEEFSRLIVCHGEIQDTGGHEALAQAYASVLKG